jgi:predicted ATP-grasp superfamily ATP-dependent carboligase
MTGDLKDFYLNTPMECYEYVHIPIEVIPPISIIKHDLLPLVSNGFIYANEHILNTVHSIVLPKR